MSEGANIRQNLQNIPSIFEITASETLDNLIYPALNKIFSYFGLRLDFKLWGQVRVREQISPLVTFVLQYLYLRKRGASFGESFYGLQRTDTATGELLTRAQQLSSATLLTLLPYLENKLRERSTQHQDETRWEKYLLKAFHAYHASKAINTLLYLVKYAASHSPIFRALRLTLRYPAEPEQQHDKTTTIFLKLLEVLAFFLQFIQWWYSDNQRRKMGGTLRDPAPFEGPTQQVQKLLPANGECPICLQQLHNPFAVSVSGFVYCSECILNHLNKKATCPVSGYPISIEDLVRIYENE